MMGVESVCGGERRRVRSGIEKLGWSVSVRDSLRQGWKGYTQLRFGGTLWEPGRGMVVWEPAGRCKRYCWTRRPRYGDRIRILWSQSSCWVYLRLAPAETREPRAGSSPWSLVVIEVTG